MKKTLITLLALCGVATADTYQSTTSTKSDQGRFYGFTFAVGTDSTALTTTPTISADVLTLNLDSIELLTRNNESYSNVKLAVYEYVSDNTTGTYLGSSSVESYATNTLTTFEFSDLTINKGTRYQFMFVKADATDSDLTTFDGYKEQSMIWGIATTADKYAGTLPTGWGIYTNNTINGWSDHRMPVMTVNTSAPVVPEPTTATLSLLALAGLAARRRRK